MYKQKEYTIVVLPCEDLVGQWYACCPALGFGLQGDSKDEAVKFLKEEMQEWLEAGKTGIPYSASKCAELEAKFAANEEAEMFVLPFVEEVKTFVGSAVPASRAYMTAFFTKV